MWETMKGWFGGISVPFKFIVGFFDKEAPLPPGQTRASQDVIQQYEDAEEAIPAELKEGLQGEEEKERSWFSYLTFGLFD